MTTRSEHLQIRITPAQKERVRRLATAAGQSVSAYVLARILPASRERFDELVALLAEGEDHPYVLAEVSDLLSGLGPDELRDAVADGDASPLPPFLANYVAAMVESVCHTKDITPPTWTTRVRPLATPHFATPLKGLRLHLLRSSPVAFKRRNLFVDPGTGGRV